MSQPVDSGPITPAAIAELVGHDFLTGGEHHRGVPTLRARGLAPVSR